MPLAAGDAQTHVDQSVLMIIAADTVDGLEVRERTGTRSMSFDGLSVLSYVLRVLHS